MHTSRRIMKILFLILLACKDVQGFLVQNGSSGILTTQTTDDRTLHSLLNLIVNEQNSRLMLHGEVTTLSDRVRQLENEKQEMTLKLNVMSARLGQMEQQVNANVSKPLQRKY